MLIISYLDSKLTVVTMSQQGENDDEAADSDKECDAFEQTLDKTDARVTTVDLLGPPGRRIPRHLLLSADSSHLLCWWSCQPGQDVFPWAPHLRDEDRANVMLFRTTKEEQPLIRRGYIRTASDPIAIR